MSDKKVSMLVWNDFLNDARVFKEAVSLQSAGYKVTVFALYVPGLTPKKEVLKSGVLVIRVRKSIFKNKRSSKRKNLNNLSLLEKALLLSSRFWAHLAFVFHVCLSNGKVVHAHDVNMLPTAWLASKLSRSKLIYDAHEISTDREGYSSFRKLVGWIEKKLMPRAIGSITTTDTRAKFFARAYGIDRPVVLQNRPRFISVVRSNRIRDELGLKESWPIVLYQGGLQQGRGLERLVDAAQQVTNAYFVFIGGGRLESILKQRVRLLGLESRVHFIPTVSLADLPSYTASADIGVQPIENTCLNHFSTDSNKLFEYMTAGLPVVASSLPEIRKLVREHNLGLVVTPGDTKELADAIHRLVKDSELRQSFGKNAARAAEQVNWEEQEGKLVALYNDTLEGQ